MAKPSNKAELEFLSIENYQKLLDTIAQQNDTEKIFPPQYLNRNIRDVLAHLHHWHLLFLEWYTVGMSGGTPQMPAMGYTWKTTPDLNLQIQRKYSTIPYQDIQDKLTTSHSEVSAIIAAHTDEELFTKKYYKWTGSTSLGAYLISATSSHYDWANKLIKKALTY